MVDNAPEGTYPSATIYQIGTDNAGTAKKLTDIYKVAINKGTPPILVTGDVRFVVIVGPTTNN